MEFQVWGYKIDFMYQSDPVGTGKKFVRAASVNFPTCLSNDLTTRILNSNDWFRTFLLNSKANSAQVWWKWDGNPKRINRI